MGISLLLQASGAKRESAIIPNCVTSDNAQGEEVGCSVDNGSCKDVGKKWNIPRHKDQRVTRDDALVLSVSLGRKKWDKRVRALTERRQLLYCLNTKGCPIYED